MSILSWRSAFAPAFGALVIAAAAMSAPANAPPIVAFFAAYPAGEIIISQHQRALYFTEGDGRAIRYPVAIGKRGMAWLGPAEVEGKYMAPDWSPPSVVSHDRPELP